MNSGGSLGVVKNDAECVAGARTKTAHTVTEVYPVHTSLTLDRTTTHSKHDPIALSERHNYGPRLHTRPLFRHHKFAAREILVRF